jgi:predicted Zn-dependent peptidase
LKRLLSIILLFAAVTLTAREKPLPQRDSLRVGTLKNGFTYYILPNRYPEGEAVYRLFVKAGSLYEEDRQRGLAHFLEHLAFNGTENFPEDAIIRVLERHGASFGKDLNAHTSYGETVYKLQLPTTSEALVDTTLLVLRDWARGLTIDSLQVEKERGVILSERLQRRKAGQAASDAFLDEILGGSRYALRRTIGDTLVIQNCTVKDIRDFYECWYRPSLMALAVVGDVDPDAIEARIKALFADMPKVKRPKPQHYGIPPYEGFAASAVFDSTLTDIKLDILQKAPARPPIATEKEFRPYLVRTMANRLAKQRLARLSFDGKDYKDVSLGVSGLLGAAEVTDLSVQLQKGKVATGIEQALAAARQIRDYGFTSTEIEQARRSLLSAYRNRTNPQYRTSSSSLMEEVYNAYYLGDAIMGPRTEYELMEKYLPTVDSLTLVSYLQKVYARAPFHAILRAPASLRGECGGEAWLDSLVRGSFAKSAEPYSFKLDIPSELCKTPVPGSIVSETRHPELDLVDWQLSNGARVLFRGSALSRNKISLSGSRAGGFAALDSADYYTGVFADRIVPGSGAGDFSRDALRFFMSGNSSSALFVGAPGRTGLLCSAVDEDIESMFRLFYLRWTQPRVDEDYARLLIRKSVDSYRSKEPNPQEDYSRELGYLLSGKNYTNAEMTDTLILSQVKVDRLLPVFNQLYGSAEGYTFVITANMDESQVRPYVEQYLAALPGGPARTERLAPDRVVPRRDTSLIRHTSKTERTMASLIFQGTDNPGFTVVENQMELGAVKAVLRTALMARLREDMGKVYSVGVSAASTLYPSYLERTTVQFSCKGEDATLLVDESLRVMRELVADPSSMAQTLADVRANLKKEHTMNLQKSSWYATYVRDSIYYGEEDWTLPGRYPSLVDGLTPERVAARIGTILAQPMVTAILYPEQK